MKHAVFTALLVVLQAGLQLPQKTSNASATPPSNQQDVHSQSGTPQEQTRKDAWDKAYVVLTGVLVLVGAGGVFMAKRTLAAIERQARTMDRSLRIDQRAWMGIVNIQIKSPLQPGRDFIVHVTSKNTGKTPARDVLFHNRMQAVLEGRDPDYSYGHASGSGMILPQCENTVEVGKGHALPQATIDDLGAGRRKLFLHGRIEYKDIFGKSHWTDWCFHLVDAYTFVAHHEHNGTDDEPEKR